MPSKPNTAKLHGGVKSFGADWPPTDAAEKAEVTVQETSKMLEQTYSTVARGAADFNQQWIEIVRANTNASFDFIHGLLGVKSPSEFIELSSAHMRKQFEAFAEHSRSLTGLAQKVTTDAVEPLQTSMKSVLNKAA